LQTKAYIRGLESEWESRLNEANAKLLEEQTEKERVLQRCQQLEDQLNATTNNLRQQYEETNVKVPITYYLSP
jgi:flagellar hook-associated protein FlgK